MLHYYLDYFKDLASKTTSSFSDVSSEKHHSSTHQEFHKIINLGLTTWDLLESLSLIIPLNIWFSSTKKYISPFIFG